MLKTLQPGKVGLVLLEFEAFPTLLINFIKAGKVNIGSFRDRLFNVYLTATLSLEPVNDNKQVLRLLESSRFDEHKNLVCYVARALEENVSTGQHFDVLWNITDVGETEECSIVLEKIYNNRLQEQSNLYPRIPSIVFLNIKQKINGLYSEGMVSFGKSMAVGKRRFLSNFHPA